MAEFLTTWKLILIEKIENELVIRCMMRIQSAMGMRPNQGCNEWFSERM